MRWLGAVAVAVLMLAAAPAHAATRCVDPARAECAKTIAEAIAAAAAGDEIEIAALRETERISTDKDVRLLGAGAGETVLAGGVELTNRLAEVADATTSELELAGVATRVTVTGGVILRGEAWLRSVDARGTVATGGTAADARVESTVVRSAGGAGLEACAGRLRARHVTVIGSGSAGARACGGTLSLRDSIVWGAFDAPLSGSVAATATVRPGAGFADPRLDGAGRLPPGSPLLDSATPGALEEEPLEWPEDMGRLPRISDGDGDGVPQRDPGAYEQLPAPAAPPAGNLLRDPGAEDGAAAWTLAGAFERRRYGEVKEFPSRAFGAVVSGGDWFFAGGHGPEGTAKQTVDATALAPEIDAGMAAATLSGLLGGYRNSPDDGAMTATFRDPWGRALDTLALATPDASARGNGTTLLARSATGTVPRLTRSIEVTLSATRRGVDGDYADAYFDRLALVLTAPGAPAGEVPGGFAGARVLTARAAPDRRGRIALRVACPAPAAVGCAGTLTAAAELERDAGRVPVARRALLLPAGRDQLVRLKLAAKARAALRARGRLRLALVVAVRDGKGRARSVTVPLRLRPG